jgi:hypothetical protein
MSGLTLEMIAVNDREMAQSDTLHKIPRLERCRVTDSEEAGLTAFIRNTTSLLNKVSYW